jgi:hypothetical protein
MHQTPQLHELLYVSTLAPDAPISVVANIAREARVSNKLTDITGLLVFDGQRFAQHLEGSVGEVVKLFEAICQDKRHIKVALLHQGTTPERKFRRFSMGFADIENADVLGELESLTNAAALASFLAMSSTIDLAS